MKTSWNNSRVSFQEHNEDMRRLRKSHAQIELLNAPRYDKLAKLIRTQPADLSDIVIEAGGTRLFHSKIDWSVLVPVPKVAKYRLSQN
jgi:hypothetical protein